jgi:two-component system cell cycle sensor histidine kinase/response regulator CckA
MKDEQTTPNGASDLRRRAEEKARAEAADVNLEALSPEAARQLLHELRVHQIQLEMQNEELRRAQGELEASWARVFDLYDLAPVGYLTLSEQGLILEANLTAAKLLGVERSRLARQPVTRFIVREDQDIYYLHRKQLFETQEPQVCEMRMVRKGGSQFWARVEATAAQDGESGAPVCRAVVSGITARKQAEEALRESEWKLKEAQRLGRIGHWEFDLGTQQVRWSDMVFALYERDPKLGPPSAEEEAAYYSPEDAERVHNSARHTIETGEPYKLDVRVRLPGGRHADVVATGVPVMDAHGRIIRLLGTVQDVTERKQLEAQLLQLQKMEAIGQLAGGIAHDFNNLLTPIGGFAELLLWKAPEGSKEQEYLRQIKVAAERAAALTRQLRLFARQAGGERRPTQLNDVVEETRDLLERSIPKEIAIALRLEPELWTVEADPSQISQVLMNLGLNARDAMPEGGTLTLETRNVTLEEGYARALQGAQPGRYVCLSVADTGCGMSPEVQARLFEPFFTTKEVGKGTGLGLAVVYGIVKGHGGFIHVYSGVGRGSTFHVYLPAIEGVAEGRAIERLELPTGTETILLVDDEEGLRALGRRVLEDCGYAVLTAENGVQALEVYQAQRGEIALVVLDVIMPQMGGQKCLRRLRELDAQVKVLISTGYTADSTAQALVAEGALGVVEKPFRIRDFAVAVRAAIDG